MNNKNNTARYAVTGISLPIRASKDDAFDKAENSLLKFFSKEEISDLRISRRSVDARKKADIKFVYSVSAEINPAKEVDDKELRSAGISREEVTDIKITPGDQKLEARPVIVGFGPCGMFCAYILAKYGYRPIIIERGSDTDKRSADVENFKRNQILDPESNIQFGAGGAGTFSDGKLMTRIGDPLCAFVVETLHRLGAPDNILYEAKPHIGTDYLCTVVNNMRDELIKLGADIYFDTRLDGISAPLGKAERIITPSGEIDCGVLVLALGHSARDTVKVLRSLGVSMSAKPFSVGARIEHLQSDIDIAMYGGEAGNPLLPHAEYALSDRIFGRGVYTFCMCPGGEVAAAASELGGVVTNGMSRHARDGKNANSAVCVSVLPEDFGGTIEGASEFVRRIERAAFEAGGKNYLAPVQTVGSFLGKSANTVSSVVPTYMNGNVKMTDIHGVFPEFFGRALERGLSAFNCKINCFANSETILTAPETRTSSPVRMDRGETRLAEGFDNIYPCGEGAGYAGGITSAAVDGIKTAIAIIERYAAE